MKRIKKWWRKRITKYELSLLSDRELEDIGISRCCIDQAVEDL